MISRRQAIRRVISVMGGAISAPTLAGLLAGCGAGASSSTYTPRSLSPHRFRLIGLIADRIIPRTDTPGALDAGVDQFVDMMLTEFWPAEAVHQFLLELDAVDVLSRSMNGKSLVDATHDEQAEVLEVLDAAAFPSPDDDTGGLTARIAAGRPPFMRSMKELTVSGYYTSKIGQTEELRPMPFGVYRADVPLDTIGRSWA